MVHRSVKVGKRLNLQISCNFRACQDTCQDTDPSGLNVLDTMVSARKFSTFDKRLQALESLVYD
jgi:hypothetical protein